MTKSEPDAIAWLHSAFAALRTRSGGDHLLAELLDAIRRASISAVVRLLRGMAGLRRVAGRLIFLCHHNLADQFTGPPAGRYIAVLWANGGHCAGYSCGRRFEGVKRFISLQPLLRHLLLTCVALSGEKTNDCSAAWSGVLLMAVVAGALLDPQSSNMDRSDDQMPSMDEIALAA